MISKGLVEKSHALDVIVAQGINDDENYLGYLWGWFLLGFSLLACDR